MTSFPLPNYTQVPNYIIDEWMSKLSHAEFKIIMLIVRYTCGYHRRNAKISLRHFKDKCSVSLEHVNNSIKKFEMMGWIKIHRGNEQEANTYEILMKPGEVSKKDYVINSLDQGDQLSGSGVINSVDHNKERERKKRNNNNEKEVCPDKSEEREPPDVVVVFSSKEKEEVLKELDLPAPFLMKLCTTLEMDKISALVKRVIAWKDRESDQKACSVILSRWDTWCDTLTKEQQKQAADLEKAKIAEIAAKRRGRSEKLFGNDSRISVYSDRIHVTTLKGDRKYSNVLAFIDDEIDAFMDKYEKTNSV